MTYKTAWRMLNKIRTELMDQDGTPQLKGQVEIDDTLVGGKARAWPKMTRQQHRWRKTMVIAAVERGGRVRASTLFSNHQGSIHPWVRRYVFPASDIFTDEAHSFVTVGREFRSHRRIRHQQDVYVSGDVHTQTVEGFFGLVKNGIRGTYHSVSKKWLDSYLNEFTWRYNHRNDSWNPFMQLLLRSIQN